MKKISFTIIAFLHITLMYSQELLGKVTNSETGAPVENANVIILGTTEGTRTNSAGYFQIDAKQGSELVISHIGYQTGRIEVSDVSNMLIKLKRKIKFLGRINLISHITSDTILDESQNSIYEDQEVGGETFSIVEAQATFRGGTNAFYSKLANLMFRGGGLVSNELLSVLFTVTENGELRNIKVIPDSSSEAEILISSLQQIRGWIPAIQGGQNVSQRFLMEIYADETDDIFTVVEEPASFPGGLSAWGQYLNSEMKYPREAQRMGIEGRVFIEFIVEKDGSLTNIRILKGIGAGCDVEAFRVLEKGPNWIPGKQRGVPVRQKLIQSVLFKFKNSVFTETDYSNSTFSFGRKTFAKFSGGSTAYLDFLSENISDFGKEFPLPNKFENNVLVEFEVDSTGEIAKAKIVNGLGDPFDSEALRLVNLMPNWTPAFENGSPTSSIESLSISFNTIPYETRLKAVNLFEKGNKNFSKNNYEKAVEFFTKAIKKNPTNLDFYFNRAVSYIEIGKNEEACMDLSLIMTRDEEAMKLYKTYCK